MISLVACRNNDNGYENNNGENSYGYNGDDRYEDNYDENNGNDLSDGQEQINGDSQQVDNNNQRPENPEVSLERAIQIAYDDLKDRGISATFRSDSGMDLEHGQWV